VTAAPRPIRIGLSARIFHPEVGASGIYSKTLQVLEQSVAQWVVSRNVLVLMIPSVLQDGTLTRGNIRLRDYAAYLDGLILQGGADVCPTAYGEDPLSPACRGDAVRDAYELELFHEFREAKKPILGICRGMQLMNVALGGALYQDLPTQCELTIAHQTSDYDRHTHRITFAPEGELRKWFGGAEGGIVNSIHHQGIKRLGRGVVVEATTEDGMIEAIRWDGDSFVFGVQWHPEFHDLHGAALLDCAPILDAFLAACE
jgi:putative glutamine amidotransferase